MPDAAQIHVGENSPENIALKLFNHIVSVEGKELRHQAIDAVDRNWVLDTFAECLMAVRNPEGRRKQ